MADVQLLSESTDAAPKEYELPAGQELVLKACFAHFDGSAAAVAWLPTLEIISDSGHVAASIPMDASVAAGASVEGTWGPFLRSAGASGGSCAGTIGATFDVGDTCGVHSNGYTNSNVLFADGFGGSKWRPNPVYNPAPLLGLYRDAGVVIPAGGQANVTFTQFSGGGVFDLTAPTTPAAVTRGVYFIGCDIAASAGWTPGVELAAFIQFGAAPFNGALQTGVADAGGVVHPFNVSALQTMFAAQTFFVQLNNPDVVNHTVTVDPIVGQRILFF